MADSVEELEFKYALKLKKLGWVKVYNVLLEAYPNLSDGAFKLYTYMLKYDYKKAGFIWPNQRTLANGLQKSLRTIQRYIKELKDCKLITVKKQYDKHVIFFNDFLESELDRAISKREYAKNPLFDPRDQTFNQIFDIVNNEFKSETKSTRKTN